MIHDGSNEKSFTRVANDNIYKLLSRNSFLTVGLPVSSEAAVGLVQQTSGMLFTDHSSLFFLSSDAVTR